MDINNSLVENYELLEKDIFRSNEDFDYENLKIILRSKVSVELPLYILSGLKNKRIDPDELLLVSIENINNSYGLMIIGFALKYGANTNSYIIGIKNNIHILPYMYNIMIHNNIDNRIIYICLQLFLIMGSDVTMRMISEGAGMYEEKSNKKLFMKNCPQKGFNFNMKFKGTVINWFERRESPEFVNTMLNYNPVFENEEDEDRYNLHREISIIVSFLVDRPKIMVENDYLLKNSYKEFNRESPVNDKDKIKNPKKTWLIKNLKKIEENFENIFRHHDIDTLKYYTNNIGKMSKDKIKLGLRLSYKYMFLEGYIEMSRSGAIPTYLFVNNMIMIMKNYIKNKLFYPFLTIKNMLIESIKMGSRINKEQLDIIKNVSPKTVDEIKKYYSRPFWKKICRLFTFSKNIKNLDDIILVDSDDYKISEKEKRKIFVIEEAKKEFIKLVFSLDIDVNLDINTICSKLREYELMDPYALIDSLMERRRERIEVNNKDPLSFINDKGEENNSPLSPKEGCYNDELLENNPYNYSNMMVSSYKNNRDNIICYTSDMYTDLLNSKEDPITGEILPDIFKITINEKQKILKKYSLDGDNIMSYSEAIEKILGGEKIIYSYKSKDNKNKIENFKIISKKFLYNPKDIETLTSKDISKILDKIGIKNKLYFFRSSYTRNILIYIISDIYNEMNKKSENIIKIIFSYLNKMNK